MGGTGDEGEAMEDVRRTSSYAYKRLGDTAIASSRVTACISSGMDMRNRSVRVDRVVWASC